MGVTSGSGPRDKGRKKAKTNLPLLGRKRGGKAGNPLKLYQFLMGYLICTEARYLLRVRSRGIWMGSGS